MKNKCRKKNQNLLTCLHHPKIWFLPNCRFCLKTIRILQDEIKKITQSEEMHGYLYNLYISNVLSYSNVLFSTLKSAKEYLNRKEEVPSELFEACLKEIKEKVKEKEN